MSPHEQLEVVTPLQNQPRKPLFKHNYLMQWFSTFSALLMAYGLCQRETQKVKESLSDISESKLMIKGSVPLLGHF